MFSQWLSALTEAAEVQHFEDDYVIDLAQQLGSGQYADVYACYARPQAPEYVYEGAVDQGAADQGDEVGQARLTGRLVGLGTRTGRARSRRSRSGARARLCTRVACPSTRSICAGTRWHACVCCTTQTLSPCTPFTTRRCG